MKKTNNSNKLFQSLIKNAIRILKNSKILMSQLCVLLIIGLTVVTTIFMSTFLMSKSKNEIIKNSDIADFTITLPVDKVKQSIDDNKINVNEYSGQSPFDLELQAWLSTNDFSYKFSKNIALQDITTNSSFLLTLASENTSINPSSVNSLVLQEGRNIPSPIHIDVNQTFEKSKEYFDTKRMIEFDNWSPQYGPYWEYEQYEANKPWELASLMLESVWKVGEDAINKIVPILSLIAQRPKDKNDYNNNYKLFTHYEPTAQKVIWNTNSHYFKLSALFGLNTMSYSSYGYIFNAYQTFPIIPNSDIPFAITYNDKSSYFSVLSSGYLNANPGKGVLHPQTISDAMQLPLKSNIEKNSGLNPNEIYKVYNQDTGIKEAQKDFISWFENLNSKYKISINSLDYAIIGKGDQPNLVYPAQSSSQLLLNSSNNGAAYVNNAGYAKGTSSISSVPIVYYSVRYPPSARGNLILQNKWLNEVNEWESQKYGKVSAYSLKDSDQPQKLFYIWANMLSNFQYILTTIGAAIGAIILLLSLIFISLLIRSIIKINKTTFGVCLANGISKTKLALSFFPFALIPAFICSTIAFIGSYFLVQPIIDTIRSYWTLTLDNSFIQIGNWFLLFIGSFVVLYGLIIAIIFITLRHNTQDILSNVSSFKVNILMIWAQKITRFFSPLWSFRTTFMMSNISRFIILTFIIVTITTLSTVIGGTTGLFNTSLAANIKNKQFIMSYDLYSPTINGGYYSAIPYSQLGTSQQGMFNANNKENDPPNYNKPINSTGSYYNTAEYNNALAYPYAKDLYFTSLFLLNSEVADEINYNFHFLNNRLFIKTILDSDVNALGAIINPWEFAKQVIPESISYLAESNEQKLIQVNFDFYFWLQQQNEIALKQEKDKYLNIPEIIGTQYEDWNNKPITYLDYLPNISGQPFTLRNTNIPTIDNKPDYDNASNKANWIFIQELDQFTNRKKWILNPIAINSAPTFTIRAQTAQLLIQMMSNNENPLFQFWYKFCYDKNPNKGLLDQIIPNYNYKLSSNAVPVDITDETYTYLDGMITKAEKNNQNPIRAKVYGIKPKSNHIFLYDNNEYDLKNELIKFNVFEKEIDENGVKTKYKVYPLVINNIAQKKYNLYKNDLIFMNVENTFDRFNKININEDHIQKIMFQIVGITPSNYGDQFYTLQKYANYTLGYSITNNSESNKNNDWKNNIEPNASYVGFNGVFSRDANLKMIKNYGGVYSPTGLSTILGNIAGYKDAASMGSIISLYKRNHNKLDEFMNANKFVDYTSGNNQIIQKQLTDEQSFQSNSLNGDGSSNEYAFKISNKILNLFGSPSAIVQQVSFVDSPTIMQEVGGQFDELLFQMEMIILLSLVPTLFIIITLLAIIIVFEAKRLIALLKLQGFSNINNLFSFLFVYIAVWCLSIVIAIPIIFTINNLISLVTFTSFSIITQPSFSIIAFIAGFAAVALAFVALFGYIFYKMKKLNLTQEIAVR